MKYVKKLITLLAMLLMLPVSYVWAAAKLPIVIEADHLTYSDATGAVDADGHVAITNDQDKITANKVKGNLKDNLVMIDDMAHLVRPGIQLDGKGIKYDYRQRNGSMAEAAGVIDQPSSAASDFRHNSNLLVTRSVEEKQYVSGSSIVFTPKQLMVSQGIITDCDALSPHYHVSAEKIEIWPGDKMIAYNAKLWIGDKVILSLPKYENSLVKSNKVSQFPRVGYNSADGFMIAQYVDLPVNHNLSLFTDAVYYTKHGFKPLYGLVSEQSNFTAKLYRGEEQNGDHEWIKKEAQFDLQFKPYRLQNTTWTANLTVGAGKWTEGNIKGWRQNYGVYFTKDPLKLSDKWTLKIGTGLERVNYGYNNTSNTIWHWDVGLDGQLSERWNVWTTYAYSDQSGKSVYQYDAIDASRELSAGMMYKYDPKNALAVEAIYNLETNSLKDMDYTWKHNMHCTNMSITYRAKRDQINFKVALGAW